MDERAEEAEKAEEDEEVEEDEEAKDEEALEDEEDNRRTKWKERVGRSGKRHERIS